MKRRDMIRKSALGVATIGIGAVPAYGKDTVQIPSLPTPLNHEMVYRPLGKTGIQVSLLGFGSHLSEENLKDEKGRDRQIQEAIENGITLFDVYDHGNFHQFKPMSVSLAGKRQKVVISLVAVQDDVRTEIEGALRTFNTDFIDLYRIVYHDGDSHTKGDDELNILFKMRDEGKIRAVGVVAHEEAGVLYAVEHTPVDYIMMPLNFHHNKAWGADAQDTYSKVIPLCREKQVGILGIKPFGGDPMVAYAQYLGLLSPEYRGPSYPKAAFRYLWQNKDISSSLPSINTVGELYDALDSLWRPEFTKEDREVLKNLSRKADKTLGEYLPPKYKWMENWRIRNA
ncbi:aldo/keto reductase [bacterium]|nr:aldo/keto reductase [bacterium]